MRRNHKGTRKYNPYEYYSVEHVHRPDFPKTRHFINDELKLFIINDGAEPGAIGVMRVGARTAKLANHKRLEKDPAFHETGLIDLPEHPEIRSVYLVPLDTVYANTAAGSDANIDRVIRTLSEFLRFTGGVRPE